MYSEVAGDYLSAGWNPLPLPSGKKAPPPDGWTGVTGLDVQPWHIENWSVGTTAKGNVALRMPDGVIGIDVDSYKDKNGWLTLDSAEVQWGELPDTWFSSARGTPMDEAPSGIYFFRVPIGMTFPGKLEIDGHSDVEIIQRGHRYAVVWPSVHPEGMMYLWHDPQGRTVTPHPEIGGGLPRIDELAWLPQSWVDGLLSQGGRIGEAGLKSRLDDSEAVAKLREFNRPDEPCDALFDRLTEALEALGDHAAARHDQMVADVMSLIGLARHGHEGIVSVLQDYRREFVADISDRADNREALAEFDRSLHGALEMLGDDEIKQIDPCAGAAEPSDEDFDREVEDALRKMKIGEEAKRRFQDEKSRQDRSLPTPITAAELAEATDDDVAWRIESLVPKDSTVILHAPAKTGKSIILAHMASAMNDGSFLDRCPGFVPSGNIVFVDMELSPGQLSRRISSIIGMPDNFYAMTLRGRGSDFDLLDRTHYSKLVDEFRALDAEVVIIDPLGPILRSRGVDENSNSEVGELLDAFGKFKRDAGIGELILSHHSGHSAGDRSRGASVFEDWPDVLISVQKSGGDSEDGDTGISRTLSAKGRDIDFPRVELKYDSATHSLRAMNKDEKRDLKEINTVTAIADIVEASPGITKKEIREKLTEQGFKVSNHETFSSAVARAIEEIPIRVEQGPGNRSLHFIADS